MNIFTINLEADMPSVPAAIMRLNNGLATAKKTGCKYVKIIHGYGSSGVGGDIKRAVISELKSQRHIKYFIGGEDFHSENETAKMLTAQYPLLKNIPEYNRGNMGITIVIL